MPDVAITESFSKRSLFSCISFKSILCVPMPLLNSPVLLKFSLEYVISSKIQ